MNLKESSKQLGKKRVCVPICSFEISQIEKQKKERRASSEKREDTIEIERTTCRPSRKVSACSERISTECWEIYRKAG